MFRVKRDTFPQFCICNKNDPLLFYFNLFLIIYVVINVTVNRQLTNEKRIYNYRLSRASRILECAFGIMVKRFNVLENNMLVGPEKATKITRAICVLQSLTMTREVNLAEIHNEIEK